MTNQKRKKRKRLTPPKLGDPNETQANLPDTGINASLPRKKPRTAERKKERDRQTAEQKQRGRKKERDRKKLTKKRKKEEEKLFGRLATKLQTDINIMNNKDKEMKEPQ